MKVNKMIFGLLVLVFIVGFFAMQPKTAEAAMRVDKPFFTANIPYNQMAQVGDCYILRDKEQFEHFAARQLDRQGINLVPEQMKIYKEFGDRFFASNNLVIAFIASGSGSLRFEHVDTQVKDDTLYIDIKDISPMMQTMDYRRWSLILPVEKTVQYNNAVITISK